MGNCCSHNEDPAEVLRDLAPRRAEQEVLLTEQNIRDGLGRVADELAAKGKNVTIVSVGGAVSTLYLKSRPQTGDVDFFYNTKQKSEDVSAIVAAAKLAAKTLRTGEAWLNNHTVLFIQEEQIGSLYTESIAQNVVIFEKAGLRVVAAPWRYALCSKLHRLGSRWTDKDAGDAVEYLHQHILKHKNVPVAFAQITTWFAEFKLGAPNATVAHNVNTAYQAKYRNVGITF